MRLLSKNIEDTANKLYYRMFRKWYSGDDILFSGKEWYISKNNNLSDIKDLLSKGYDVRTGFTCSSIRGSHFYHVFYKK